MALSAMTSDSSSTKVICKIVLVGDVVGKTSLVNRFFNNTFIEYTDKNIGFTVHKYSATDNKYTMFIWDSICMHGAEYEGTYKNYISNADAVILCFAADNLESYNIFRTHWLLKVHQYNPNCQLYMCATMRDRLTPTAQLELLEHYVRENRIDAKFYLTSAKTGENVQEMFMDIFEDLISPDFQQFVKQQRKKRKITRIKDQKKTACTIN